VLTNKVRRLKLTLEQYCDRVDEKFWESVMGKPR